MHVKACKKTAKRRRAAAFGLRKDGVLRCVVCEKTARSCVWAVERWHGAAFGRHCACKKRHAAQCVRQQEFYHVPHEQRRCVPHAAPKHVPMQEKHLAHAFPTARQNTFPCKNSTLHMQFYRYAMHYKIMVDFTLCEYFNREQFITEETVDAEITVVMPVQRIHGAEMWIRNKLSNGPLRA